MIGYTAILVAACFAAVLIFLALPRDGGNGV